MTTNEIVSKLKWSNGMILISESETQEIENSDTPLPCKKSRAVTPWKRQRDEIMFQFFESYFSGNRPVLIFANSIVEVNLLTVSLRDRFPSSSIAAIGTNMSSANLQNELLKSTADFYILSAQSALLAFVHGFIKIDQFSILCFADARGANQNHPFCLIMNHFYTPFRQTDTVLPRVLGFSGIKTEMEIETDLFSKRDWIKTLKHYTHTFHSIPIAENEKIIENYLDSFSENCPLFDPLSIYETTSTFNDINMSVDFHFHLLDNIQVLPEKLSSDIVVFKQEIDGQIIAQFVDFLANLKAKFPKIHKFVHIQSSAKFSAQLSLFVAMRNLKIASEAPSSLLDPEIANSLVKDASNLFSQSEYLISMTRDCKRILRNPINGSLLIESTATPILVRACALLSRQFRQSAANETILFKTLRVFPIDANGKKTSTSPSHLTLLRLPVFFYERIKSSIRVTPENEQFHLQGPLVNSRHQAQCCSAFDAARLLFDVGILDSNLQLAIEYRKSDQEQGEELDDDSECTAEDLENQGDEASEAVLETLSFNELIPKTLLKTTETRNLFIYALEYEMKMYGTRDDPLALDPDPVLLTPFSRLLLRSDPDCHFFSVSKSKHTWSIVLPTILPEYFVPTEIPIGTDHFLQTKLKFIGEIPVDSLEYEKLLEAQQILFGMFNMKPITVPDVNLPSSSNNLSNALVPLDKQPFYLIAPLVEGQVQICNNLTDLNSIPKVWDLFQKFVEDFRAAPLEGTLYNIEEVSTEREWSIDWSLIDSLKLGNSINLAGYMEALEKYPTDLSVQLEEGGVRIDFKRFALERLAFYTPHTKIFYRLNPRPLPEPVYPSSPFTSSAYPQVTTHAEYVSARYNLQVAQMDKEVVAMKRIENWSDLAVWISEDGATKQRRKRSNTNHVSGQITASLIIPELARIFPAPYSLFRLSMLLPRVSFEIERQLRIAQFFTDQLPDSMPRPSHFRQIEAMTSSTSSLSYSYEQLEVLGDSFLKYYSTLDTLLFGAGWSEGRLSSHRQQILCNANLRRAAEKLKLTTYASFTPFFAKLWCPPAIPRDVNCATSLDDAVNCTLFDPAERWKCLRTVEGKQVQRQLVYLLDPEGNLSVDETYKTKEQAKNSTDAIYKYGQLIPPKSLADMVEALIGIYYIDCGVMGCLQFLEYCGILRPKIFSIRRDLEPMKLVLGETVKGAVYEEQVEKLKRRKLTPMNSIVLGSFPEGNEGTETCLTDRNELVRRAQSIEVPLNQKIDNVLPHAPNFSVFPFDALERLLGHSFKHRELLFMACTHSSVDAKLNNERLEWIGDAAIDWIVCRHYWYTYRLPFVQSQCDIINSRNVSVDLSLEHSTNPHVPTGFLPLSPESLTNARQSAINNESFARLAVKYNFHQFLRINSPHLQIEIDRFADEMRKLGEIRNDIDMVPANTTYIPELLNQLHTHVSVAAPKVLGDLFEALMGALLLDSNYDINHFNSRFDPFLRAICADPADLPTNAIQETLHLYARLGVPRHQIVFTYKEIGSNEGEDERCLGVICQVWVRERCVAEAEGSNKSVAKKLAMEQALKSLKSR